MLPPQLQSMEEKEVNVTRRTKSKSKHLGKYNSNQRRPPFGNLRMADYFKADKEEDIFERLKQDKTALAVSEDACSSYTTAPKRGRKKEKTNRSSNAYYERSNSAGHEETNYSCAANAQDTTYLSNPAD